VLARRLGRRHGSVRIDLEPVGRGSLQ
jgi:hypothetical protein